MTISLRRAGVVGFTLAALAGLVGCSGGSAAIVGPASPPSAGGAVLVGKVEPLHAGSVTASQVAADDTGFGFSLFTSLCAAAPTSNLTLSPASAAEALGMLDAGSVGKTRAAVSALLELPGWSSAVVAALNAQSAALAKISQVTVTNHVFEATGLMPTQQSLDDLRTAYGADLRQLDFAHGSAATDAINAVISHDTDGLIPNLFDQPLDPMTRTVLANAILLNAKWQQPFPMSQPGVFHTAAGGNATTSMMQNADGEFASRATGGWQSVVLPYTGNLQAVALLPPAGATAAAQCATPSAAAMTALTSGPSQAAGVVLPKLNLSQTLPLTQVLAKLGLPLEGDFSGLGKGDDQITEVVQKVVMKVDQQGTKAAAATGIGMTTSAKIGPSKIVTFDRPFLLLVEDTATHTPLFLTRVADPTQS
jgi:serpin B